MLIDTSNTLVFIEIGEQLIALLIGNADNCKCGVANASEVLPIDDYILVNASEHAIDQIGVRESIEYAEEVIEVPY